MVDLRHFKGKTPTGQKVTVLPVIIISVVLFVFASSMMWIAQARGKKTQIVATQTNQPPLQGAIESAEIIAGSRADHLQIDSTGKPEPTPAETAKSEAWEKERERIRQKKQMIYEAALVADTKIDIPEPKKKTKPENAPYEYNTNKISGNRDNLSSVLNSLSKNPNHPLIQKQTDLNDPNLQASKEAFLKEKEKLGYLKNQREFPISPYEIKSGEVIPAVMISGVNSDLPGYIIAQVSQNVYDTAKRKHLLIPQGSKLVGRYDSQVAFGQNRAMIAWDRINFPDGSKLDLSSMPGADQAGYAGFSDQVDNHYRKVFGGAFMLSFITAAFQMSQPEETDRKKRRAEDTLTGELGKNFNQVGADMIRKNLNIQPTLKIRPGYKFNVFVSKDIALQCAYSQ